jgi:hypothetical protein
MAKRMNDGVELIKTLAGTAVAGQGRSRRRRWRAAPACVLGMSSSLGVKVPCAT